MEKKENKILYKMSDMQADWASIGYVPFFNIITILFNRKDKVVLYHSIRSLIWMLNMFIPALIIHKLRTFTNITTINGTALLFIILYFVFMIYSLILIIEYINYFIDCRKCIYKAHLIDKIFGKSIKKIVKQIEKKPE